MVVAGGAVGADVAVGAVDAVGAMVVRLLGAMKVPLMRVLSLGVLVVVVLDLELTSRSIYCITVELDKRQVSV